MSSLQVTIPALGTEIELWVDTGMIVMQGQSFSITAGGLMRPWSYSDPFTPDGKIQGDPSLDVYVPAPFCALIGCIASTDGPQTWNDSARVMFTVGSDYQGNAARGGKLFLGINDVVNTFSDNSGSYIATVSTSPANDCLACDIGALGIDQVVGGNPISLYLGEKREEITDLSITTPAGPLAFTRTYRQSKLNDSNYQYMGLGWTHNHYIFLTVDTTTSPHSLSVWFTNGSRTLFVESAVSSGNYLAASGSTATVTYTGSQFVMTTPNKSQYIFELDSGDTYRLEYLNWVNGQVWTYTYNTSSGTHGQLTDVSDTNGNDLSFSYNEAHIPAQFDDNQLSQITDQAGRTVSFGYITEKLDGSAFGSPPRALLATVTDVLGNVWSYDYYGQHVGDSDSDQQSFLIERLSPPVDRQGSGLPSTPISMEKVAYTVDGSTVTAITQAQGDGALRTDWAFQPGGQNLTTETTSGKTTAHYFDGGVYIGSKDPGGNPFNTQQYNGSYKPRLIQDGNGNSTQLHWSIDGKSLLQVTDALGNQTHFTYNVGGASDNTISTLIDPQGHQIQYTYADSTNPQLPTRVQAFATDGLTCIQWQEFTYDDKGRVLIQKTFDPTSNGTTLVAEVDTTYYASGNGMGLVNRVTQKDLQNPANDLTTTYFYDSLGRLIRTNQSATFGSCTSSFTLYDAAGKILASVCNYDTGGGADPLTLPQVLALYNSRYPDKNRITAYGYDALGRLTSTTTNAGSPDAQTSITVYDSLHRVVRTITNYTVDAAIPDPYIHAREGFRHGDNKDQNLITDTAYNERGFLKSQTDVLGMVTLYGYDDAGRSVKTIRSASQPDYNNAYTWGGDPSLSQYIPQSRPDQDIITTSVYDAAGNVIRTTDPSGTVTLTGYDALNRPVRVIQNASQPDYNSAVDPTLSRYISSPAADRDITSTTEYDALGHVRRSQDPLGRWTLYGFDSLGRSVKTIGYASQPGYNIAVDPDLSNYLPGPAADQDIVTQTAYDALGRVMYTADTLDRRSWSAYDGLGRAVRTIANATGMATDGSARDPRALNYNPVTSASDVDLISTTTYDSNGFVLWTQDPIGRKTWQGYDQIGRQIKTIGNAVGAATNDGPTDPRISRYLVSSAPDQDIITQTQYDSLGRVAATFDSVGHQTRYTYDRLGRTIKTIANFVTGTYNPAVPDQDLTSTTAYDLAGRVSATVDSRGTQTAFVYDRAGRRLAVTQAAHTPLATTSYTCYDKSGRVLRTIQNYVPDPAQPAPDARDSQGNWLFNPQTHGANNDQNIITTYTLDALGRLLIITDTVGQTRSTAYYKDGQVQSLTDVLGVITQYRYDQARRRVMVVQSYTAGTFTDPATWVWNTGSSAWQDGKGNAITFGSNNDQNSIVQTEYDKAGQVIAIRDPNGNRTTYSYDKLGRRTGLTDPLGNTWTTAYTNANRIVQTALTNPLGQVTLQSADLAGRLKLLQYLSESPKDTPDVTFSYDKLGNRLSMVESNGAGTVRLTHYAYDNARRLREVDFDIHGDGSTIQTVAYQYEAGGLRTQLTLPDDLTVTYTYDARGQLTSLTDWSDQATQYSYDAISRLSTIQRSMNTTTTYQYDPVSRLTLLRHVDNTGHVQGHYAYTVDARGNRTQAYEALPINFNGATTYPYNDPSIIYAGGLDNTVGIGIRCSPGVTEGIRGNTQTFAISGLADEGPHTLVVYNTGTGSTVIRFQSLATPDTAREYEIQTIQYTYDNLARLLTTNQYPGLNTAATPTNAWDFQYDPAGNRTHQDSPLTGTTDYVYDAANRLNSDTNHTYVYDAAGRLTTTDGSTSHTWDRANRLLAHSGSTYAYDGDGRRTQQTVSSTLTTYLHDIAAGLPNLVQEITGADTTSYIHAPQGIHQQQNPDSSWFWTTMDGLGSVRSTLDSLSEDLECRNYSPYGELIQVGVPNRSPFSFTGEYMDSTNLLYLRARYYNPDSGRFFMLDPLEGAASTPMSLNRYMYGEGNVVNVTDPSGMCIVTDVFCATLIVLKAIFNITVPDWALTLCGTSTGGRAIPTNTATPIPTNTATPIPTNTLATGVIPGGGLISPIAPTSTATETVTLTATPQATNATGTP